MGWFRSRVTWSSCELDYLKLNRTLPVMQLAGYLAKSANAVKKQLKQLDMKPEELAGISRSSKGTKIGKRPDIGVFMRSGWECDFCRYLKYMEIEWKYEPIIFGFIEHGVKKGAMAYTPDFQVFNAKPFSSKKTNWIEVKGYLKPEDKTKLRRFKKYYPEEFEKLIAVCGSKSTATWKFFAELGVETIISFNELKKQWKNIIPHWES